MLVFINVFCMDNVLYGILKVVEILVFIYNKDLIDKLLDSLQVWLDYLKIQCEQNKYGLFVKFDQIYYSWGVIGLMGGYIFVKNDSGGFNLQQVGFNIFGVVEVVIFLKKFYVEKVFLVGIFGDNGLNVIDFLFIEKKVVVVINGFWVFQLYEVVGINYGVVFLLILLDGKLMSFFFGVKGYVVLIWSKDKVLV